VREHPRGESPAQLIHNLRVMKAQMAMQAKKRDQMEGQAQ
jgi:hypothetical protein